jgi:hypothetical protein
MTLTAKVILTWFVPGASSASGGWKKPSPPNAGAVILQQFVRAAIISFACVKRIGFTSILPCLAIGIAEPTKEEINWPAKRPRNLPWSFKTGLTMPDSTTTAGIAGDTPHFSAKLGDCSALVN